MITSRAKSTTHSWSKIQRARVSDPIPPFSSSLPIPICPTARQISTQWVRTSHFSDQSLHSLRGGMKTLKANSCSIFHRSVLLGGGQQRAFSQGFAIYEGVMRGWHSCFVWQNLLSAMFACLPTPHACMLAERTWVGAKEIISRIEFIPDWNWKSIKMSGNSKYGKADFSMPIFPFNTISFADTSVYTTVQCPPCEWVVY